MTYNKEQWITLSERFNQQSFTGKVLLIKQQPSIFKLEYDGECFWLRLVDEQAMKSEFDMLFSFPSLLSFEDMRDLLLLLDLKLFPAK